MRALFIISYFPPMGYGGERQALLLAKTLVQQGSCVEVLTRHRRGLKREDSIEGVSVHRRGVAHGGKIGSVLAALLWTLFILRYGRRYDVFHAHQPHSAMLIALLGKLVWGGAAIVKMPGTRGVERVTGSRVRAAMLSRFVDAVAVMNRDHMLQLEDAGLSTSLEMIPNGVDLDRKSPSPEDPQQVAGPSVVFAGRLIPSKGVDLLLRCWKTVQQEAEDSPQLWIVGDGSSRSELEELVRSLGLRGVHFIGMVDDALRYTQGATVCVCPSRPGQEGLSNTLLEAMALDRPIVATNVEGMRDVLVNEQNGLLVNPGSPYELAQAILRLLGDSRLRERLGENARHTVERQYSIQQVAAEYRHLYQSITER